jgi:hypothetical protein
LPRDINGGMWLKQAPSAEHDFRAAVRALAQTQVDAPPELMFSYSNVGLEVVGAMVEAASGQPFEQRVQESVLAPLGMQGAQFSAAAPTDAAMALGYFKGKVQNEPALRDVPAGGLTASVTDLARFLMMQFSGGRNRAGVAVLPPAQQAAMLQPQYSDLPLDADTRIGLGWMLSTFDPYTVRGGGLVAQHSGATFSFRSQMMMLPEHKLGVIVASNDAAAGKAVYEVAQRALGLLLEARSGIRQTPSKPGFVPSAQAWTSAQQLSAQAACVGDYASLAGPVSIKPKGQGLSVLMGERTLEVRPGEAGRFGLRYRLAGLFPIKLGVLSEVGLECLQIDGRHILRATLNDQHMLVGQKLPQPLLPADASRWIGRYRPRLLKGEIPALDLGKDVRVFQADGRLWVEFQMHEALGGEKARALLQPISQTALRFISGPLSDTGPVVQLESEKGQTPRFRFSGWIFDRVAE